MGRGYGRQKVPNLPRAQQMLEKYFRAYLVQRRIRQHQTFIRAHRTSQRRFSSHLDMAHQLKVPRVTFFSLVHIRFTGAIAVLHGRWCGNNHYVRNFTPAHHQPLGGQVAVDRPGLKDARSELIFLKQARKLQQICCLRGFDVRDPYKQTIEFPGCYVMHIQSPYQSSRSVAVLCTCEASSQDRSTGDSGLHLLGRTVQAQSQGATKALPP